MSIDAKSPAPEAAVVPEPRGRRSGAPAMAVELTLVGVLLGVLFTLWPAAEEYEMPVSGTVISFSAVGGAVDIEMASLESVLELDLDGSVPRLGDAVLVKGKIFAITHSETFGIDPGTEASVPGGEVQAKTRATATAVVRAASFKYDRRVSRSAWMAALILAEERRFDAVNLHLLTGGTERLERDGLTGETSALSGATAVLAVAPALRSVRRIGNFGSNGRSWLDALTTEHWKFSTWAWLIRSPIAWPGGSDLWRLPDDAGGTMPGVNPLYRFEARTTSLPFVVCAVLGWLGVAAGRRRWLRETKSVESPSVERPKVGWLTGVQVIGTLVPVLLFHHHVISRVWLWLPDSPLSTAPGLTLVGALAGIGVGAFWHRRWLLESDRTVALLHQAPRDLGLRSALFREIPVDDVRQDRLGFAPLVRALHRFLDNADTEPPVIISVNGPWGSGKSSLMKMLAGELRKTRRFDTVWFNAWRYKEQRQVMAAFLQTIARELSKGWGPLRGVRLAWARFQTASTARLLAFGLPLALLTAVLWEPNLRGVVLEFVAHAVTGKSDLGERLAGYSGLLGLVVYLVLMAGKLQPFALGFTRFFAPSGVAGQVNFLDDFTREFSLYRKAAGRRKLLILIDDLDRCSPDQVVEVLKAINLIVTSDAGAGHTFFVLGYDPKFIVRSIEKHYADYAADEEGFGVRYLKKMVTLSVSVPRPSPQRIHQLIEGVEASGTADDEERLEGLDTWVARARQVPAWALRVVSVAAVLALLTLALVEFGKDEKSKGRPESAPGVKEATEAVEPTGGQVVDLTRTLDPPVAATPLWVWGALALVLVSGSLLFWLRSRPLPREVVYRREERDSERFLEAVQSCRDLLPTNPRDAIRLVNLMRMGYLIQTPQVDSATARDLPGSPLDEESYVLLSALRGLGPDVFGHLLKNPELHSSVVEAVEKGVQPPEILQRESPELYRAISRLALSTEPVREEGNLDVLRRPEQVQRYLEVNRYLLEVDV